MTPEEIVALPAGRELDALLAEKVMGLLPLPADRCPVCGWPFQQWFCEPGSCSQRPAPTRRADEPAPYSTDIAAAWQVVERFAAAGAPCQLTRVFSALDGRPLGWRFLSGYWPGCLDIESPAKESAPHAICLEALLAVIIGGANLEGVPNQ